MTPYREIHAAARDRRVWWIAALQTAAEVGDVAAAGEALSEEQAFVLAGIAVRAPVTPFPLPFASATAAAGGFHQLVRGFSNAAEPALKAELGRATAAAARCCLRLLEIEAEQQAAAQRRRYGED
jgi:hypothetical protein